MISKLKKWLPAFKPNMPEEGIHVTHLGVLHLHGDRATLALSTGARHTVIMNNSGLAFIAVSISSVAHPGGEEMKVVQEFPLVRAQQAQDMFSRTVASWFTSLAVLPGRSTASRWPHFVVGMVAGAILLTAVGLMITPRMPSAGVPAKLGSSAPMAPAPGWPAAQPQVAAANPGAMAPDPAALAQAQRQLEQARLSTKELERVGSAHRIAIRPGSSTLTAFSDPNCPACQELEREAGGMKAGQGFSIIPVAFQPGSRALVAQVLCSKDPARAWVDALGGRPPKEPACDSGLRQVDENNALFSQIGASATPTLVAANGQLAQGAATTAKLELFAANYAK